MNYTINIKTKGLHRVIATAITVIAFLCGQTSSAQTTYRLIEDIPYYSEADRADDEYIAERCKIDLYYPENSENYSTVVWFHGGGITAGQKEIPAALKEKGMAVIGVNYRLSPKVKAPAYIEDAAAAVAWTFQNIKDYGGNPDKIFLSGHSAGGYLISMVGLDVEYLKQYDIDANRLAGLIPFSGHTITHFTIRAENGIKDSQPIIDQYAPLYHVRSDAPPLLLITGDRELELLGRYEENAYLMRMMKVVGHTETHLLELDGYNHGMTFPAFPLLIKEIKRIEKQIP